MRVCVALHIGDAYTMRFDVSGVKFTRERCPPRRDLIFVASM